MTTMTAEQKAWVERKLDKEIKLTKGKGKVVDYKPDTVGAGVYLIVERNTWNNNPDERYIEVPVNYPHEIQSGAFWNQRVKKHQRNGGDQPKEPAKEFWLYNN